MFRIEAFVDDRKLAEALRALSGIAVGAPTVQPVVNAVKKNGKVAAASEGSITDLFAHYAKTHGLTELKPPDMKDFCKAIGRSVDSYSYFTKQLTKLGAIKRTGRGRNARYRVVVK